MKLRYILYLCLCLLTRPVLAQQAYAPEKLSKAINSPYPELNPVLSPDEKTLYFVRANHPDNSFGTHDTQDIWYSQLQEDGSWSEAKRLPDYLNRNRYNAVYAVYNDGNSLLLHGRYNKKGNIWKKRGLSVSHRSDSGWSAPKPIKVKKLARKNKGLFTTATVSNDGEYLVLGFSKRYNSKKSTLFVSRLKKNGKGYGKPKKLKGFKISGASTEAPFLSHDGKVLYFTSNLTENHQIYRTERLDNSGLIWDKPASAGDSVNTMAWESYFSTSKEGNYGFFSSNRDKAGADLYRIKLVEVRPFVLVKGHVLSPVSNTPPGKDVKVSFYANGVEMDSVIYQPDSGSFKAYLPLGEKYEIKAEAYSHRNKTEFVDATDLIEYSEMEKNLFLELIPVARIEGSLLIRSSNTPIPAVAKPSIIIDGKTPDSLYIDPINNRYQLWLPYGKDYTVQVQATGYRSEAEELKLSHIDGYKEVNKNLYVDTERMATISGTVFDKKTGKPFTADVPVQIILNDSIEANIVIDGESSGFTLELPLGTRYAINAKAEGYYPMVESVDLTSEEQNVKVLKDLYLAPIEVGQTFRINNIFFETGKAALKTESFPELDRVVTFLGENPKMKIEIAGHTDNVGSVASNKKLSAARARTVADYVIMKGVDEDRITSRGYGSSRPEADNNTELGRSLNRRVEFTILEIVK